MCPFCIAAAAQITVGVASTGGFAALLGARLTNQGSHQRRATHAPRALRARERSGAEWGEETSTADRTRAPRAVPIEITLVSPIHR